MNLNLQVLRKAAGDIGTLHVLAGLGTRMFDVKSVSLTASVVMIFAGCVLIVISAIKRTAD